MLNGIRSIRKCARIVLKITLLLPILLFLSEYQTAAAGEKIDWQKHWQRLGEFDSQKMFPSFQQFIAHPDATIPFLAGKLQPTALPDARVVKKLIGDLNDPAYAVRAKAQLALGRFGGSVEHELRQALEKPKSNEVHLRLTQLLKKLQPHSDPNQRRIWRALEILEEIGTREAKEVLRETAKRAGKSRRAKEAKNCLQRLNKIAGKVFTGKLKLRTVLKGHTANVYAVAFSPDGKYLVSGGTDDTVKLWDIQRNELIKTLGSQNNVYAICFTPDGDSVYTGGTGGAILKWSISQRKQVASLSGHTSTVRGLDISPDGKTLATCSYDDTVILWELPTLKIRQIYRGHTGSVYCVAFSADGKRLASGSSDDKVAIWSVGSKSPEATLVGHGSNVYSIAYSNDGKSIMSSDSGGRFYLWETLTRKPKVKRNASSTHRYFDLHPDGKTAAFVGGAGIFLRDVVTGTLIREVKGHTGTVRCVAFSPDGRRLATGSYDDTIRIWDLEVE